MKAIAWSAVWWPNVDKEIKDIVRYAGQRSLQLLAPLHSWPWTSHPMQRIRLDFTAIEQFQVLVIIDSHS